MLSWQKEEKTAKIKYCSDLNYLKLNFYLVSQIYPRVFNLISQNMQINMSKNLQSGTNAPNLKTLSGFIKQWIHKTNLTPNSTCHATYRIYTIQLIYFKTYGKRPESFQKSTASNTWPIPSMRFAQKRNLCFDTYMLKIERFILITKA